MPASFMLPPALANHQLSSGSVSPPQEVNQTAQVLDNTVVGITVGESSISGLQDPVQLTFAHRQLPRVSQPCLPSVSPPLPLPVAPADAALPCCRASPRNAFSGIPAKVHPRQVWVRAQVLCPALTAIPPCLLQGRQEAGAVVDVSHNPGTTGQSAPATISPSSPSSW